VKRPLKEEIVDYLHLVDLPSTKVHHLAGFGTMDWERTIDWLRDAGIALYFLQRLKDTNSTEILPPEVLARLERNLASNRKRVVCMENAFALLNQRFNEAGVRYAAVKGLSLVPEFIHDECLRTYSDLDYLVEDGSLTKAQSVVEKAGYDLIHRGEQVLVFAPRLLRHPRSAEDQYEARVLHTVEVHLDIVDSELDIPLGERQFSARNLIARTWNGSTFYALPEEEVFLLQVRHAFSHVVNCWPRLSWLLEIGYFLKQKVDDAEFWGRVEREVGNNRVLRDVVVVMAELSARMFGAPLSTMLNHWSGSLRPGARLWIEIYARKWVLAAAPGTASGLLPPSKLVLFLHQQFMTDQKSQQRPGRVWLLHPPRLRRVLRSMRERPLSLLQPHFWHRAFFHANAGLRYLLEVPRWRYLNRKATRWNRESAAVVRS